MIKTDEEIIDDVMQWLNTCDVQSLVTGVMSPDGRPLDSTKEDVCVSVLSSNVGQIQTAFVNVNVYVEDIMVGGRQFKNRKRLLELSKQFADILRRVGGGFWRFELEQQRVMKVEGMNCHLINNRLFYQYNE